MKNKCRKLIFLLFSSSRVDLFVKKQNCRNLSLILSQYGCLSTQTCVQVNTFLSPFSLRDFAFSLYLSLIGKAFCCLQYYFFSLILKLVKCRWFKKRSCFGRLRCRPFGRSDRHSHGRTEGNGFCTIAFHFIATGLFLYHGASLLQFWFIWSNV